MRWLISITVLAMLLSHVLNAPSREREKMMEEIDAAEEELIRNTEPVVHAEIGALVAV